jgi:hypothetical protein
MHLKTFREIQKYILIKVFVVFSISLSSAQGIRNSKAELDSGKVIVTYDLIGGLEDYIYSVQLYSSSNSFRKPLTKVTGDVGRNIKPGNGKKAIWDAESELVKYRGEATIRVEVKVLAPFVRFISPSQNITFKRGKTQTISWEGGTGADYLRIVLMNGRNSISDIGSVPNEGSYNWDIPPGLKPGKYSIRISGGGKEAISRDFTIRRKIPLGLKILPLVAVGVVVAILVDGSGKEVGPIVEEKGIPNPPDLN